jgi:acyl-CoA synthetase (AMP-forming)/AMP-acid ligase II
MSADLLTVLAQVSARPDPNGLPGSDVAERLVNGLFFYTLLGCLAGLLISIIVWVFASRAQNFHHAATGRQGTIIAFFGALIAGAAPALINFFQNLGEQVR